MRRKGNMRKSSLRPNVIVPQMSVNPTIGSTFHNGWEYAKEPNNQSEPNMLITKLYLVSQMHDNMNRLVKKWTIQQFSASSTGKEAYYKHMKDLLSLFKPIMLSALLQLSKHNLQSDQQVV